MKNGIINHIKHGKGVEMFNLICQVKADSALILVNYGISLIYFIQDNRLIEGSCVLNV